MRGSYYKLVGYFICVYLEVELVFEKRVEKESEGMINVGRCLRKR